MPSVRGSKPSLARRRACQQCFDRKIKCEPRVGGCPQCLKRGLDCVYLGIDPSQSNDLAAARALSSLQDHAPLNFTSPSAPRPFVNTNTPAKSSNGIANTNGNETPSRPPTSTSKYITTGGIDDLVCNVDVTEIRARWLNAFLPVPQQTQKDYPASITSYISRTLKSYSSIVVRQSKFPPFVHASQVTGHMRSVPLINCLSIARLCSAPVAGSESFAQTTIEREMEKLLQEHKRYNEIDLLAAFQAYLIYCMALYFDLGLLHTGHLREFMINLQDIACEVSTRGLVSVSELNQARPGYDVWIVAEAKRRTLYTMYLFDSVICARDALPTYIGSLLSGLPAPASQDLWETVEIDHWNAGYNTHLHAFVDGGLRVDELWPLPQGWSDQQIAARQKRVDKWLESVDKFGTMLYAVTICTHGG